MVISWLAATASAQLIPLAPTLSIPLPAGDQVYGISAGDFDGDGQVDLAWSRFGAQPAIEVVPGIGGGLLGVPAAVDTDGGTPAGYTAAADVDGDGFADLFALVADPTSVWRGWKGDAAGLGAPEWSFPVVERMLSSPGDLDGDGIADLVLGLTPYLGSAAGPVAAAPLDGGFVWGDTRVWPAGDVDGDGTADLWVPDHVPGGAYYDSPDGALRLFLGPSFDPQWAWDQDAGTGALAVMADMDGNGADDLVAFDMAVEDEWAGGSLILIGDLVNPSGPDLMAFSTPFDFDIGQGIALFAPGDVDGDGAEEIGWGVEGQLGAFSWDGSFDIVPNGVTWQVPAAATLTSVVTTDLDGDGRPDLIAAFADPAGSSVSIWLTDPGEPGETGDTGAPPVETGDTGTTTPTDPPDTDDTGTPSDPPPDEDPPDEGCGCTSTPVSGAWILVFAALGSGGRTRHVRRRSGDRRPGRA